VNNFHLIESQARAHTDDLARRADVVQRVRNLRPGLRSRLAAAAHALANRLDSPVTAGPDTAAA
jgi:hypothetical protein